jgi:hypothetical protein
VRNLFVDAVVVVGAFTIIIGSRKFAIVNFIDIISLIG